MHTSNDIAGLYDTIHRRRDVRAQFTGEAVEPEALRRVLGAAHAAPSVGLSQPWDFIQPGDVGAGVHWQAPAVRRPRAAPMRGRSSDFRIAAHHPPSQAGAQWLMGGRSPVTVAGPCRTHTGFPDSPRR